jgi:hypothetical protein
VEVGVQDIVCLDRCSREVQLRISFGLVCCQVLLVVNTFFSGIKVTNADEWCFDYPGGAIRKAFVGCPGATGSPSQNSHPLIRNGSAIVISI